MARKLHQETELGKILDPVADKLMIIFVILALIIKSDFPVWLGILIFLRDLAILLASFSLMREEKQVKPSVLIGKITFAFLSALIFIYILDLHQKINLEEIKRFFIVICSGFLIWSIIKYYDIFKQVKKDEK